MESPTIAPAPTLLDSFEQHARVRPTHTALLVGGSALSYAQLLDRISNVDIGPATDRQPIALEAKVDLDSLVVFFACLVQGRAVFPFSPSAPQKHVDLLLERSGASRVFSNGGWRSLEPRDDVPIPSAADWVLLQTSGTTGSAKIVSLSERALLASADASNSNLALTPDSSWALTLPYCHVGGLSILLRCARAGAKVVCRDWDFRASESLREIENAGISHLSLVPTQLYRALETGAEKPSTLRAVLVGGASSSPVLRRRARAAGWPVAFTYGFTEAGSQVCTQSLAAEPDEPERDVGHPIAGTEVALDGAGRISVRGATLMNGYWGQTRLEPGQWFVTQDLGYWDAEDRLVISGRADNMIISGGENVSAQRVEEALVTLEGIDEAVVFGVEDPQWGSRIVALVAGKERPQAILKTLLEEQLEPFAIPKEIHFRSTLPRHPNGKLDRVAARETLDALRACQSIDAPRSSGKVEP